MARHRRRRTLLERLRDRRRRRTWLERLRDRRDERIRRDPLIWRWERFHNAAPRGQFVRTSNVHVRPHMPMPGPVWILKPGVMTCYDRLWDRALIMAERKLRGVVLP